MKKLLTVVAVALVASLVMAPVASAQEKWVRGTVVSVVADTLTVKAVGKDMSFKVDAKTELTARGAGTAQREAERKGAGGVKLTDFVKPGVGVEVHYKDVGGVLTAIEIYSGLTVKEGAVGPEVSGGSARGAVTAVSGTSITVKGDAKEWTFAVDSKTTIVGKGLSTLTRQLKEQGKAVTVTEVLGVGDKVVVYFQEATGTLKATEINVVTKAVK